MQKSVKSTECVLKYCKHCKRFVYSTGRLCHYTVMITMLYFFAIIVLDIFSGNTSLLQPSLSFDQIISTPFSTFTFEQQQQNSSAHNFHRSCTIYSNCFQSLHFSWHLLLVCTLGLALISFMTFTSPEPPNSQQVYHLHFDWHFNFFQHIHFKQYFETSVVSERAPKWRLFTFNWPCLLVATIIVTGAKEEASRHSYRAIKSV